MILSSYDTYVLRGAPIGATRAKLLQQRHGRIDKKYVVLPFKNRNFCINVHYVYSHTSVFFFIFRVSLKYFVSHKCQTQGKGHNILEHPA